MWIFPLFCDLTLCENILVFFVNLITELHPEGDQLSSHRSKRCIVVQKQSHSPHRTSSYDDDYEDENSDSESSFGNGIGDAIS